MDIFRRKLPPEKNVQPQPVVPEIKKLIDNTHQSQSPPKHPTFKSYGNKTNLQSIGLEYKEGTGNPLSPFLFHPKKARFVNKEKEEKVVLIVRKHPITNLKWMLTAIAMMFMPLFFSLVSFFSDLNFDYRLILSIIWYLIVFAFVFEEFLMWFFHVNILTDERIIEVDFINIFHREMTDANIDQIQDVTVELGGGLRTFFNYGNVIIQTAAEVPRITFESVPKPDVIARILRESRVEEEREKLEGRVR